MVLQFPDDDSGGLDRSVIHLWGLWRDIFSRGYQASGVISDSQLMGHVWLGPRLFSARSDFIFEWWGNFL